MRHTMVLILIAFIPAISFSKVYRRVELSPVHPGHEPFTGGFSGSRLNIIDFSDAGKEQIDKWFPVNKVAVFEVKNKNSEPIDLINLGSKEIKDIIKKIRVRKGSRASKISLLIDLEDLPYLSGVHQFIRQNKLESLFVVGGVSDTMIFDEVFWKNFKMFALLTQSIRRYVLIPASVDSDIRSRMRGIFLKHEFPAVKELKESVRLLISKIELEKARVRRDGLKYLKEKNNLSEDYQFTDEQIKEITKKQKNLNATITSVNSLAEDIRRSLLLLRKEIEIKKIELSYDPRYQDIVKKYESIPNLQFSLPEIALPNNYSVFIRKAESLEKEQKELEDLLIKLDSFWIGTDTFKFFY